MAKISYETMGNVRKLMDVLYERSELSDFHIETVILVDENADKLGEVEFDVDADEYFFVTVN